MDKKIAMLGAGAIGSSIGADLTRTGYDVVIIDQWPAHVDAMKANGLRVSMPDGEWTTPVQACHICDVSTLAPQLDIVFFSPKSYDTRWMTELIKPYLKPGDVIVGVQNGVNDEAIVSIVGYQRVIACAFELSAEVFTPGRVQRNSTTIIIHHGKSAKQVRGVVLQDYLKGRYTETDYLSGLVVSKGKEAGVPTPANEAVTEMNRQIRRGALKPDRSNLALVEEMIR